MLSKEAISQFQKLYQTDYGVELSESEAKKQASKLLNLYRAVYNPEIKISRNNHEKKLRPQKNSS